MHAQIYIVYVCVYIYKIDIVPAKGRGIGTN